MLQHVWVLEEALPPPLLHRLQEGFGPQVCVMGGQGEGMGMVCEACQGMGGWGGAGHAQWRHPDLSLGL